MSDEPPQSDDSSRTVFMPAAQKPTAWPETPAAPASPPAAEPAPPAAAAPQPQGRVEIGSVLNHIYEIKRFIARGGMGEVYEGANINSDERVAIKVMLPQLAADPNVQEMFRKEARTLTKLSHPALVQYRLLAQEPQLGVLYIVTEFIDGAPLSDVMGRLHPGEQDLRLLLRRLAEGLKAAHELGAVHRDIAPDNVLLPDGRLDRAKIIDFGIAKDLDPSKATIVGDGFAGKLGYVAPEQFGDFDRQIGPWTDVYSVGLVILAAALGKDVDMGATLVEAVDRRRAGPDLSPIPPNLRPVLERMLKANPAERLRSMDEVLAALDGQPAAAAPAAAPSAPAAKPAAPSKPAATGTASGPKPGAAPLPLLIGGGVGAVALIGLAVFLVLPKHPAKPAAPAVASTAGVPKSEAARRTVEAALPSISCTWLDISSIADQQGGVALRLAGVAGSSAAAENAVSRAAGGAGATVADINMDDVAPVNQPVCEPLDAFRAIRAETSAMGRRLETAQRAYQIQPQSDGKVEGRALITMNLNDPSMDFALFGLEPSGAITALIPSRQVFEQYAKANSSVVTDLGSDRYRLQINTTHTGWSGLLLLTGKGPFDPSLVAAPAANRPSDWTQKFKQAADAGGWKAEMVWYKTTAGA